MNQELLVVGIDISKNFLDVFVSGSVTLQRYANDTPGRAQLACPAGRNRYISNSPELIKALPKTIAVMGFALLYPSYGG